VIARPQGRGLTEIAEEGHASVVVSSSVKAALDVDWEASGAQQQALRLVLDALDHVERWLDSHRHQAVAVPQAVASVTVAQQVREQDVTTPAAGLPRLRQGVVDSHLIVAVGVTPANAPKASVTDTIASDLAAQRTTFEALLQELRERQQTPQGRKAARACGGRACPGPYWALARPPSPLPGRAEERVCLAAVCCCS
jgi:hypothetical protein